MKIDPAHLAFDIDGVVADTMSLFLTIAKAEFGINHIRYEDITDYDLRESAGIDEAVIWEIILRILEGKYVLPLDPIRDAPEVLKRINRCCHPTLFVTARPEADLISEWLCSVLQVPPNAIEVVATGSFEDKREVLTEHNIFHFVEDRLETCYLLAEAGIQPIVFAQPWNRKGHSFREVGTWRELETMIVLK
ncbi:MAG: haloacid dehalogenase [Desulfobacteraceae bacterium]|nr:haloacid dehalogenase [Desulfobacteraceae bacterium]